MFLPFAEIRADVGNGKTKVKKSRSPLRSLIKRGKHSTQVPVNSTTISEKSWKKWLSRPNIEYQTQRVKFGFGRANRTKLFEQFARSNGRLRDLLDTSEKSAALKQARDRSKNSMLTKAMCGLWRHATSLHGLLEQAWGCQCKHMHRIHLLLYSRANVEQIEYSVCFMYTPSTLPSYPWTCMEVAVQHVEKKTLVPPPLDTTHSKTPTPASPINPSSLASKPPNLTSKSALRSPTTSRLPSHQRVNWRDSSKPSTTAAKIPQDPKHEIKDLCSSIANCGSIATCLGTLEGDEGSYLLNHNGQPCDDLLDSMSLETLLQGRSGVTLDRRQRYTIALMLVSSHLQLYPSPWLSSQWSKKDIIFVKDRGNPLSIKLDKPYMRRDATPAPSNLPYSYATKDRLLPTLGILLIELCFGTALEDHEMRKKCQIPHTGGSANADLEAALDLGVALEWSRSVGGEAGERYADAVQWCLKGQATGAKDDRWREELYTNVVSPLEFCYEQFSPPV